MQAAIAQASFNTLNSLFIKLDTYTMCLSEMPHNLSDITSLHTDSLLA